MNKITAAITGVQGYVPDTVLSNADLAKIVDTSDEWITTRTGIKERRIMKNGASSDMAAEAVKGLLEKTNTDPLDIDLVVLATVTPDYPFPSTANLLCDKVGMKNAWGFDLKAACSGFIYALSTGSQFIETGRYKKVIVVGVDKMTSILDYQDRTTCVIFGDGAGAVLLEPNTDGFGVKDFILRSDGSGVEYLVQPAGGSLNAVFKNVAVLDVVDAESAFLVCDVFKYSTVSVVTDPLTITTVLSILVTLTPSGI